MLRPVMNTRTRSAMDILTERVSDLLARLICVSPTQHTMQ